MSKESGGVGSFLFGAVLGAAAGVLFAPQAGADTRAYLKEKASAYLDNADVFYESGRDRAVELYSTASGRAGEASGQIKDKIDAARSRLTAAVGQAAEEGEEAAAAVAAEVADGAAAPAASVPPTPAAAPVPPAPAAPAAEKPAKGKKA